jgi:hypothetical protein
LEVQGESERFGSGPFEVSVGTVVRSNKLHNQYPSTVLPVSVKGFDSPDMAGELPIVLDNGTGFVKVCLPLLCN